MDKKYKIIALFGKSGAGKDTLLHKLHYANPGYNKIIMTTTRPKRDYEMDGLHYHFVTEKTFAEKLLKEELIEATSFNNWFYGTDIHELDIDRVNIGAFNINAIECMLEDSRLEVYPIYIEASDKTRLLRNLNREENPNCAEICRRYFTDEKDFDDIPFEYDIVKNDINNPVGGVVREIMDKIN